MKHRPAVLGDAERVRDLVRRAYAEWVPLIGREPRPMAADYERAITDHQVEVWGDEGEIFGVIELVPEPNCLLIENVAVDPSRRGQGLGSQMLRYAEDLAGQLGLGEVRLYTNAAFVSNLALYSRRGYLVVQHEPLSVGGTLIHMRKRFT